MNRLVPYPSLIRAAKTLERKPNGASLGPVWLSSSLISPSRNLRQSDSLYHAL